VVVEGIEGEVGQDLTGTGTDRNAPAHTVNPDKKVQYLNGTGALEHPTDFRHQPIVIDTVKEFAYIRLQVVAVPASREVMRQLLRTPMDASTYKT
jgi:hypothetical protein